MTRGCKTVQLTVVQAPKHVLNAVPAKAQIERPVPTERRLPTSRAIGLRCFGFTTPEMSDRVANEDDLGIEPIFDAQHLGMPGMPIVAILFQFGDRNQGGIARNLDRERLVHP